MQKLEDGVASLVLESNGDGDGMDQVRGSMAGLHVTVSGVIYIADYPNNRVQRWASGAHEATTVADIGNDMYMCVASVLLEF